MAEQTGLDWSRLTADEIEQIEQALDRWEQRNQVHKNGDWVYEGEQGDPDCPDDAICSTPKLVPFVRERIRELSEIERFLFSATNAKNAAAQPEKIGAIQIIDTISKKSSCTVYAGLQDNPRRRVAVKMLVGLRLDPRTMRGFAREIQTLAKLRHAGIAEVFFAGECELSGARIPYFAMEYVDGPTITGYCQRQRLSQRETIHLFLLVCEAIEHAHQRGVIHRDIKPTNILTTGDGRPKVLDFGIAADVDPTGTELSLLGVGTPAYMSPEQFDADRESSIHTDVYSLGVLLYELLCGELPYDKPVNTMAKAARTICTAPRVHLRQRQPHCHPDLAAVVEKCLARRVEERYQSVGELVDDLNHFLSGHDVTARPLSAFASLTRSVKRHRAASFLAVIALVSLLAGGVTSVAFWQREKGVSRDLAKTVFQLRSAQTRAKDSRDRLSEKLSESERSKFNHVLAIADQHWESSPELVRQWLEQSKPTEGQQNGFAYRVAAQRALREISRFDAHDGPVRVARCSVADSRLLTLSDSGRLSAWDLDSGKLHWQHPLDLRTDGAFDLRHDGAEAVTLRPTELRVFRVADGSTVRTQSIESDLKDVRYAKSGEWIYGWGDSPNVMVWDTQFSGPAKEFAAPFSKTQFASIDELSNTVTSVSPHGMVCTWDLEDRSKSSTWQMDLKSVGSVAFSNDGKLLAAAARFGDLNLYDLERRKRIAYHPLRDQRIDQMAFSSDDKWLLYTSRQRVIGLEKAQDWKLVWNRSSGAPLTCIAPGHSSDYVLGLEKGQIQHCSIVAPAIQSVICKELESPKLICLHQDDSKALIAGTRQVEIDLASGRRLRILPDIQATCRGAVVHSNQTYDVAFARWKTAFRFQQASSEWIPFLSANASVTAIEVDEQRGRMMVATASGRIMIADLETGRELHDFQAHQSRVMILAFDPVSGVLASGSADGEIAVWDQQDQLVSLWKTHQSQVWDLAFSPDGQRLFSASRDCTVGVFDLMAKKSLSPIRPGVQPVRAVSVSPDGQSLAIGGVSPEIILCDAITGEFQATLRGHADTVTDLEFSADGRSLLSVSLDGTLRRWTP